MNDDEYTPLPAGKIAVIGDCLQVALEASGLHDEDAHRVWLYLATGSTDPLP